MEDKRLDRLYDYTKWHLGIYLSSASAFTLAAGILAKKNEASSMAQYVGCPWLVILAVILMFSAGMCGGIVASSCTECTTYEELWNEKHGPRQSKILTGCQWAGLEHLCFWLSVACAAGAVLSSAPILRWLGLG